MKVEHYVETLCVRVDGVQVITRVKYPGLYRAILGAKEAAKVLFGDDAVYDKGIWHAPSWINGDHLYVYSKAYSDKAQVSEGMFLL